MRNNCEELLGDFMVLNNQATKWGRGGDDCCWSPPDLPTLTPQKGSPRPARAPPPPPPRCKKPSSGWAVPAPELPRPGKLPLSRGERIRDAAPTQQPLRPGRRRGFGRRSPEGRAPAEETAAPPPPPPPPPPGHLRPAAGARRGNGSGDGRRAAQRRVSSPGTGPRRRRLLRAARGTASPRGARRPRPPRGMFCGAGGGGGGRKARAAPPGPASGPASAPWRAARSLWRLQCRDGAGPPAGRDNGCAQRGGALRGLRRAPRPSPKRLTPSRPPPSLRQSRPEPGRARPRRLPRSRPSSSARRHRNRCPPGRRPHLFFRSGDWAAAEIPPGRLVVSVINQAAGGGRTWKRRRVRGETLRPREATERALLGGCRRAIIAQQPTGRVCRPRCQPSGWIRLADGQLGETRSVGRGKDRSAALAAACVKTRSELPGLSIDGTQLSSTSAFLGFIMDNHGKEGSNVSSRNLQKLKMTPIHKHMHISADGEG
ncbi:basic proline-rich protein-like [Aquila chrysaetos chrysaetos]|uniref:basic proline-rich protein-like n=1 Tax=Aquila chrysaetos chrysaetos TaxID=223781 RepID=UPI001176CC72|nr:basic proline-rich protein-like [Aquila chrysaetos chrysaetos]